MESLLSLQCQYITIDSLIFKCLISKCIILYFSALPSVPGSLQQHNFEVSTIIIIMIITIIMIMIIIKMVIIVIYDKMHYLTYKVQQQNIRILRNTGKLKQPKTMVKNKKLIMGKRINYNGETEEVLLILLRNWSTSRRSHVRMHAQVLRSLPSFSVHDQLLVE